MKKRTSNILKIVLIVALVVALAFVMYEMFNANNKPEELSYGGEGGFQDKLKAGEIAKIYYEGGYTVKVLYANDSKVKEKDFPKRCDGTFNVASRSEFEATLKEIEAQMKAENPDFVMPPYAFDNPSNNSNWTSLIIPILSVVGLGVIMFLFYRQSAGANGKAMNFGKTNARLNTNVKVRFSDVAGAEEEKAELAEVVDFLKSPKKYQELGARIPKGVLLVGPPGTGKTLFAKAVAGEANVPFFSISGSDFVEMFVGTGAARVRDLFEQAKRNMPCIIFIDEIDAVGRQRGAGMGGGHDEREQTLNQLLVQMDGFEKNEGIIIMAATNRADILDPALLRPGRFDRQIYVNVPDVKGREAILKVHSRNKPLAPDISFKILARMTSGFSGADIENLLNEASILAARANRTVIIMEDILEGINKVIAGPQKRSRVVTEADKRITAYHEAGHAIIARVLPNCDEVQEVSIIPRGMAAGYTLTRPDNDDEHMSKGKLNDMITMLLAGRAAEEIVIHDITTGASSDIKRASSIARSMVTEWGMSELGNIFLGGSQEVFLGRDYSQHNSYSEEICGKVDEEVMKIIDENYQRALSLLKDNRKVMDAMVKVLFEKETIYTEEVSMLFNGNTVEEVCDFIDKKYAKREEMRKKTEVIIVDEPKTSTDNKESNSLESDIKDSDNKLNY